MTETTTTVPGQRERSPESRFARESLRGLRADLFRDVTAYRPLPRLRTEGPVWQLIPAGPRSEAGVLPHLVVLCLALLTFAIGLAETSDSSPIALMGGLIVALPVGLTLIRPVLAWWLSLAAAAFAVVLTGTVHSPWSGGSIAGHTIVMALVAARTRPRTAAWMWIISVVYSVFAGAVFGGGPLGGDSVPMLVFSGVVLALVAQAQVSRSARREVAVERTVTAVERDKRTLLEERTTIARELHDVVAHHMSVVAIQAEAAPYRVENPPPELEQAFVTIRENAVAALTELRRVLGVVRAEDYQAPDAPQPTLADLDRLLENVRDAGLTVSKAVTGAVRELPPGVELSAYRIVQEALSNALRHAPGAEAAVEVSYVLGGLGLRIVNGPPTGLRKESPGAGHGITGMRERVAMLGGEMTAEATRDGGYEVAVFVPVAAATEPETDA
ncbi:sensor histidine kinase [Streptomyces sp. VRA16 Mangrove soil]|uniref:sensor histidine kinase n=1 Tax=Streptomyces sp. VRA16 Mangrove soil TaxID=2817434 RepID=UPI001A9D1096|nr:histidine kinase [Streptomyces sp. VRA16 Mangrove soil]MBO1333678.1 two-component sensor histidine kinase [Streptomyces sp. VRA16 Mangrove soil]